jgi:hypothetical protein
VGWGVLGGKMKTLKKKVHKELARNKKENARAAMARKYLESGKAVPPKYKKKHASPEFKKNRAKIMSSIKTKRVAAERFK